VVGAMSERGYRVLRINGDLVLIKNLPQDHKQEVYHQDGGESEHVFRPSWLTQIFCIISWSSQVIAMAINMPPRKFFQK
jgi:hypothetical protein